MNQPGIPRPSKLLRARLRIALGMQPLPTFGVPFFILPGPTDRGQPPRTMPFWALQGNTAPWWQSFKDAAKAEVTRA